MTYLIDLLSRHWPTLPLVLPLIGGFATALVPRYRTRSRRTIAVLALAATAFASTYAVEAAAGGVITTYEVSGWAAPFGIELVVDRLAALMLATTSLLGLSALLYSLFGTDLRGDYFHALFLVQIAGINGAFLTGDLFNLFVFFEVLLISSYSLLVFGGGERRTGAATHYIVLNLVGSAIFLMGVGLLYGITGTLNMTDLGLALADLPAGRAALARSAAMLLMVVFGLKSALVPLYVWLPRAYSSATAPVAALFAIMTKVGLYAIIRTSTLVFGAGGAATADITAGWGLPLALATLLVGAFGAAAARRLSELVAYVVIVSVGTILVPIHVGSAGALAAALYYLVHSTFVAAALFLIADMVARLRGDAEDRLDDGPALEGHGWLAVAFLTAGVVSVGLPPTSGFLGKTFILEATIPSPTTAWEWGGLLGSSFLVLLAFALAGSRLFWKTEEETASGQFDAPGRAAAPAVLLALIAGWTVFAGPAYDYIRRTAVQTLDRENYVHAVDPQNFDPSTAGHGGDGH